MHWKPLGHPLLPRRTLSNCWANAGITALDAPEWHPCRRSGRARYFLWRGHRACNGCAAAPYHAALAPCRGQACEVFPVHRLEKPPQKILGEIFWGPPPPPGGGGARANYLASLVRNWTQARRISTSTPLRTVGEDLANGDANLACAAAAPADLQRDFVGRPCFASCICATQSTKSDVYALIHGPGFLRNPSLRTRLLPTQGLPWVRACVLTEM